MPDHARSRTERVVLLGTSGYRPNDHRQTVCIALPELGVILDAGTAMYRLREYLATDSLQIFLSHAHFDHVIGLTYLFDVVQDKPMRQIVVYAEADKLAAVEEHLFAEPMFPARPAMQMRPLDSPVALGDSATLSWFPLTHPGGCVGFRIDWPHRSMAYVSDTSASETAPYVDRIRGVDLLIHECFFDDGFAEEAYRTGHSCASWVAQVAMAAEVGRLVLVHFDPRADRPEPVRLDAVRSIFAATEIGYDRMELRF